MEKHGPGDDRASNYMAPGSRGQPLLAQALGVNPVPSSFSIHIRAKVVGLTPFSLAISLSRSTVSGSSPMAKKGDLEYNWWKYGTFHEA